MIQPETVKVELTCVSIYTVLNRLVHKKAAFLDSTAQAAPANTFNPELFGDASLPTGAWGDADSAFRMGPNFEDPSFRLTTKRTPM